MSKFGKLKNMPAWPLIPITHSIGLPQNISQALLATSSQGSPSHVGPLEGRDFHKLSLGPIPWPHSCIMAASSLQVLCHLALSIWSLCLFLCICALCKGDHPRQLSPRLPGSPQLISLSRLLILSAVKKRLRGRGGVNSSTQV